jgi:hypothetical protein
MTNIVNVYMDGLVLLVMVVRDEELNLISNVFFCLFKENVLDLQILFVIRQHVLVLVVHQYVNVQDMRKEKIVLEVILNYFIRNTIIILSI